MKDHTGNLHFDRQVAAYDPRPGEERLFKDAASFVVQAHNCGHDNSPEAKQRRKVFLYLARQYVPCEMEIIMIE